MVFKNTTSSKKKLEGYSYGDDYGESHSLSKQGAQAEDDGYLLELLMNEEEARLIILDAKTSHSSLKSAPSEVPFGVHSLWLPEGQLNISS